MHDLRGFLEKIYPVERDVLDHYCSMWKDYSAPRKTIITAPTDNEKYLYFVQEGIQKSYYQEEGRQHITFFAYAPSFSGIVESFLTQTPSKYFLETITASKFKRISYQNHVAVLEQHRAIETLFRKATESFLIGVIERHHQLMAFDIETRFGLFLKRSPHLLNLIPQKDLASYLRIDPTNFSKLLNRVKL